MNSEHNMTDYEKTYTEFKYEIPKYHNFAANVVDKWAKDPTKLAMLWVDDNGKKIERTFYDFSIISKKIANVLSDLGVCKGDVVIIMLGRQLEWWDTVTACIRMGAIFSPSTTQLTSKDIRFRINNSDAICFITDTDNAPKLEKIADKCPSLKTKILINGKRKGWINLSEAVESASSIFKTAKTKSSDNCLLYFTSGTTGQPKMTLHTHSYPIGHITTGKFWLDLTARDLHWNISDTGWAKAAWSSYFGPWNCGSALFTHCSDKFDPVITLDLLNKYPITTMCGAPTIYRMLVQENLKKYIFSSLRHCVGAGEPLNPEVIEVWEKATGVVIRDGYGQTETALLCCNFPCIKPKFGSMGKPSPGYIVHIIDENGNVVLPDTEGDFGINIRSLRPAGLFKEYWKEPDRTALTYRGDYYLTGDRGYMDKEGYFWFVGRSDDVIISSGYRIGPFEVESALIEHPAVIESAVVSSPDKTRGEIVKAFVILASGFKPSQELVKDIQDHVKKVTAPYKYPRQIDFIDELPKTVSGKIRRVELRQAEWEKKFDL